MSLENKAKGSLIFGVQLSGVFPKIQSTELKLSHIWEKKGCRK